MIVEGIQDLREFATKRGIEVKQRSPFFELVGEELDLLKLLTASRHWWQEMKPEFFETICIQDQRLSEKDLRELRSSLKKKAKSESLH